MTSPRPPRLDAERRLLRALGARIAQLREERGLTQKAIGEALGMSQDLISRYERGATTPKLVTLLRLRQLFAVTLDHLVVGAAKGEVTDPRLRKLALAADTLPYDHRTLVVTVFQRLVEATQEEVRRTRPPESEE